MKTVLIFIAVVSAVALLGFAVHDVIYLGRGLSSSAAHAPKEFWGAFGDAVKWSIEYKEAATVVLVVCLAVLYVIRAPSTKRR